MLLHFNLLSVSLFLNVYECLLSFVVEIYNTAVGGWKRGDNIYVLVYGMIQRRMEVRAFKVNDMVEEKKG